MRGLRCGWVLSVGLSLILGAQAVKCRVGNDKYDFVRL